MTVISNQWSAFSNRVFYFALCTILFTFTSAKAQQPKKVPRIGYLSGTGSEVPNAVAFRQGLRDLGYIEGKNILVEYR
jgi:putative ABC transport system substrate-binding protein